MAHPSLLIEHWLPIEAIGAESKRERGASSALPPLYFLHIWWARRPLMTSRAAILGSVLPQWSLDWPTALRDKFPNEAVYHQWFLQLSGIFGDPAKARKLLDWAKQQGTSIANPYEHARAFTVNPSAEDLQTMGDLLEYTWGTRELSVLDPFAGGGSIPFEALRYGFTTIANDLNPVAAVILKATLEYPARFGPSLADDIRKWGKRWYELVKPKLQPYFTPLPPGAEGAAYLWARTVVCPTTGKPVPLSPNWWLRTDGDLVAVKLIAEDGMNEPHFEIVTGAKAKSAKPDVGTITRGVGRSPWTGETIDGEYIKAEAHAGRMGQMLYAVATKVKGGFEFRAPSQEDLMTAKKAEQALVKRRSEWIAKNIIPTESFPSGNDNRPLIYGMPTWANFFSPRQLLAMGTFTEALAEMEPEMRMEVEPAKADAIKVYLTTVLSKVADRNAFLATWIPQRLVIGHVFQRHDFAFVWAYAEFDAAGNLLPWAIEQIEDAYKGLAGLIAPSQQSFLALEGSEPVKRLKISQGSATALDQFPS